MYWQRRTGLLETGVMVAITFIMLCAGCGAPKPVESNPAGTTDTTTYQRQGLVLVPVHLRAINSLTYQNQAGEKHVALVVDHAWHYGGMELMDSAMMASYLSALTAVSCNFPTDILQRNPDESILIDGVGQGFPILIVSYGNESNTHHIHSSAVPDVAFCADSCELYKTLFTALKSMLPL